MFFSLLQTLVCVLLVNSGLYALHLTGSNTPVSSGLSGNNGQAHASSQLHKPSANPFKATSNRLNEELADLAQLERERLMVMGLVKQTAEESGYHGRPIITGRIKMHPPEDIDSEYSAWLNQQARNVMFGNVVKQPLNDEPDYDTGGGVGAFAPLKSSNKYDYGRPVQTVEREFETPHNLDLDDFIEMEPAQDEEDMFPDMDGYDYIEELMTEENKERLQHHYQPQQHQQMLQFPGLRQHAASIQQQQQQQQQQQIHLPYAQTYQNHEALDSNQQTLEDFFEKEQKLQILNHQQQQQQQQQQQANEFNAKYRNNRRMQQKWLRKRNQMQQPQLPRNIFGQKNAKQQQAKPQHHFNSRSSNKLAVANSEATATTRVNSNKQTETAQQQFQTHEQLQQQQQKQNNQQQEQEQQQQQPLNDEEDKQKLASSSSATKSDKSSKIQEQKPELLQHPNHKRSGLTPASLASAAGVSSPHSLASQLMLRTARGQRQYDVPQIECPTAMDGMERFACPTPDVQGRYRCIDDHVLCDGFIDCPEGEDEDRRSCMFYKTTKAHLDVLADALLRWARGRR